MKKKSDRATLVLCATLAVLAPRSALAVPSFARQTGLQCTECHTTFFQLTPFGRWFKLTGYVYGDKSALPPLAGMAQGAPGYTITGHGQPGGAAPHFGANDNWAVNQLSAFYAGRLFGPYGDALFGQRIGAAVNHVGVFAQGTWNGVDQGPPAWDNTEIRFAGSTRLLSAHVDFGAYVNN